MGLMTSFTVGVSGLKASQTGVNTTAHNLTNVSTEGYSRQEVLSMDFVYNKVGYTHINTLQIGLGSEVGLVRQHRDYFLDKAYRLETGRKEFYNIQSDIVGEIESLFGELEGVQFQDTLSDVWEAVEELAKEPDSIVKRTALIETADTLLSRAQDIGQQLKEYQVNLNTQIKDMVKRVNEIGHAIHEMNSLIIKHEVGSEQANDYRDRRNVLLDELATYAKISYHEDHEGRVTVNLEGTQFVSMDYVYEMETEYMSESTRLLNVVWKEGNPVFDLNTRTSSDQDTDVGKLKGLLIARGSKVANYTDIPNEKDEKYYTADGKFNSALYSKDVLEYNNTIDPSIIMSTQSGFDRLINGIVTAINDALNPNASVDKVMSDLGYIADMNAEVTYVVNTTVGGRVHVNTKTVKLSEIRIWDEYNAAIGMDDEATPRQELFSRQGMERYSEATITVTDVDGNTVQKKIWIYNEEDASDPYSQYTIEQLVMNDEVKQDPSKLPITGNNYQGLSGAYDKATCERLLGVWNTEFATLNPNILTSSTFTDYYTVFIGHIATVGNECLEKTENQEGLVATINDRRQSVSGVSSDEELSNLIMYQHAYNANSRYITAIDSMLEHIITKLG